MTVVSRGPQTVYGPKSEAVEKIPKTYGGMPDALCLDNAYCVAKRVAEHYCALYRHRYGIETVVARCFAFVGRDLLLDVHFAIGDFVRDALTSEEIIVRSDEVAIRSYTDQRDSANWLVTLIQKGRSKQAYNVGSDRDTTIREVAYIVRDTLALSKNVWIAGSPAAVGFRNKYASSIQKARTELGLDLTYTLIESIKETAKYALI